MKAKNVQLRNDIHARHAELLKTWVFGDPPLVNKLAEEFKGRIPSNTLGNVVQMVRYYLRETLLPSEAKVDRRKTYSKHELDTLKLQSPAERQVYARATGRSIRAIDAAISRYVHKQVVNGVSEFAVAASQVKIQDQGFFNYSSPADLKVVGVQREEISRARNILREGFGLSLRAPNILYHAPTKRRYTMTTFEQLELVKDPRTFLKKRSEHISKSWVVSDCDPVDDPLLAAAAGPRRSTYGKKDTEYPLLPSGAYDATVKATRIAHITNTIAMLSGVLAEAKSINPLNKLYVPFYDLQQVLASVLTSVMEEQYVMTPVESAVEVPLLEKVKRFEEREVWEEGPGGSLVLIGTEQYEVDDDDDFGGV